MHDRLPYLADWKFVHEVDGRVEFDSSLQDTMMLRFNCSKYGPIDISDLNYKLRGKVYNREGFRDGDMIETSRVKTIHVSKYGYMITTQSGSQYEVQRPDHTIINYQ